MQRDLVVVGASAGGVGALRTLVSQFPADLAASVVVVLHMPANGSTALPAILARSSELPVSAAADGTPLRPGHVHVAPPDHHVLVHDDTLRLSRGPTENGYRPAANVLFRSAALAKGPSVIGVVLSGVLDDGVAGMAEIKNQGGLAVVQSPDDATHAGMPENVLRHIEVDHVAPAAGIGSLITSLVGERQDTGQVPPASALFDTYSGGLVRAMWTALRSLDEKVAHSGRIAAKFREMGRDLVAQRFTDQEEEALAAAHVLREYLLRGGGREETGT